MDPPAARQLLDRLHDALAAVYAGEDSDALGSLLTDDVEWHVPGENAIAGSYRGIAEVREYFQRRRRLAANTLRLYPGEVMVGDGGHVAVLTEGGATISGAEHRWSTVGLYRIRDGRIAGCWLLPLDDRFERAWAAAGAAPGAVGPRTTVAPGAQAAPVLILTGPPGVGKTSVSRALAARYELSVHLESDDFYTSIRSGFIAPWQPESQAQNTTVMGIVANAASGYAGRGYVTIVDGIVLPRWFLGPVWEQLAAAGAEVAYAVLRAPLGTCLARCAGRAEAGPLRPAVIERLWLQFADLGDLESHVVDVTDCSVDQAAQMVADRLGADLLMGTPARPG